MRLAFILLFISSMGFAQVNSSNVTWKSRVETNEIYSMIVNGNFIYADQEDNEGVTSINSTLRTYQFSVPAQVSAIQGLVYQQDSNLHGNTETLGDSVLYRGGSSALGGYFQVYRINNGLLSSQNSINTPFMSYPIQILAVPELDLLLVLLATGDIIMYDNSAPFSPATIGAGSAGNVRDFLYTNGYLYVGNSTEIKIVDVDTNTPSLTQISQVTGLSNIGDINAHNNTLYVAAGTVGISLYDISNPLIPVFLGSYDTPDSAQEIAVNDAGNIAYVADNSSLQILDVSDPANIVQAGYYMNVDAKGVQAKNNTIVLQGTNEINVYKHNSGAATSLTLADPTMSIIGIEGGTMVTETALIQNNGSSSISVNSLTSSSSDFLVDNTPFVLAPGQEQAVPITFNIPSAIGSYPAIVMIDHSGVSSPDTLSLKGEVIQDYLTVNAININNTALGDTTDSQFQLYNSDVNPFSLEIDSVALSGSTFTLNNPIANQVISPNTAISRRLIFTPIHAGDITDTAFVYYNGTVEMQTFTGFAFGPQLLLPENPLLVSDTEVGGVGEKTVYLKNLGNRTFDILNLDLPDAPFTAQFDTLSAIAGDSLQLEITFTPTEIGTFSDSIVFEHNEFTSPTVIHLIGVSGLVGTGEETPVIITEFALQQNYPNPFNPETRIAFDLPQRSNVELIVYDLLGRKVQTLKSGTLPAGQHQVTWNGRDNSSKPQSSGVYVYQLQYETADGQRGMLSEKMVLLK